MSKRKPAIKSSTMWGIATMILGAALPALTTEVANMPPSTTARMLALALGIAGGLVAARGRMGADAEISGVFKTKRREGE